MYKTMFKQINQLLLPLLIGTIGSLFFSANTFAACGLNINLNAVNLTWSQNFNSVALTLTLSKTAPVACTAAITFGTGHASNYNRYALNSSTQLPYQLYQNSGLTNILEDQPNITSSNNYISYTFSAAPNQNQTITFYLQIPYTTATSPTFLPYGSYTDNVAVKVFENPTNINTATPSQTSTLNINIAYPELIEMSFSTSGSGYNAANINQTLNLGNIATSQSQSTGIVILSNGGYAISMSSLNNGVLVNTTNTSSSSIPYSINFNGTNRILTNTPAVEASGSGQTSSSGVYFPLSVTTVTTPSALTGNYSDSISITAVTTQ